MPGSALPGPAARFSPQPPCGHAPARRRAGQPATGNPEASAGAAKPQLRFRVFRVFRGSLRSAARVRSASSPYRASRGAFNKASPGLVAGRDIHRRRACFVAEGRATTEYTEYTEKGDFTRPRARALPALFARAMFVGIASDPGHGGCVRRAGSVGQARLPVSSPVAGLLGSPLASPATSLARRRRPVCMPWIARYAPVPPATAAWPASSVASNPRLRFRVFRVFRGSLRSAAVGRSSSLSRPESQGARPKEASRIPRGSGHPSSARMFRCGGESNHGIHGIHGKGGFQLPGSERAPGAFRRATFVGIASDPGHGGCVRRAGSVGQARLPVSSPVAGLPGSPLASPATSLARRSRPVCMPWIARYARCRPRTPRGLRAAWPATRASASVYSEYSVVPSPPPLGPDHPRCRVPHTDGPLHKMLDRIP